RREVLRPAPSTQPNHHVLCQAAKRCCHHESAPDRARAGAVTSRLIPPHYNMKMASRSIRRQCKTDSIDRGTNAGSAKPPGLPKGRFSRTGTFVSVDDAVKRLCQFFIRGHY